MELLPKRPPAEEEGEEEFAEAFGAEATTSRFDAALEWINPLVGKMPYGLWTGGIVPSGSPAWATNAPPPSRCYLALHRIFCAGVPNLMLRFVGKRVPTYGNLYYDGGMVAYWSYFECYHQSFDLHAVRRGDLLVALPQRRGPGIRLRVPRGGCRRAPAPIILVARRRLPGSEQADHREKFSRRLLLRAHRASQQLNQLSGRRILVDVSR
jgi:hypothetical protein